MITRPILLALAAIAIALAWSPPAWTDDGRKHGRGIQNRSTQFTGIFEAGFTEQGPLRFCQAVPGLPPRIVIRASYSRLAGVCDDQSSRPCQGRLTRLTERCFAEQLPYPIDPTAGTVYVEHKVRICYDESGEGHCEDVDEVASGTWYSQFTDGFFNNMIDDSPATFDETVLGFDREVIKKSKPFKLDGRSVRVPRGTSYGQSAARLTNTCLFELNACPQTGSLVYH